MDRGCSIGKRNDEEGAKEKLFTYASHVVVDTFKVRFRIRPRSPSYTPNF